MKMLTATRVAALAVGLSLVAGQAFAADENNRGQRNNQNTAADQEDNDQGDRDRRRHKKQNPQATAPQTVPAVAPVVQPNQRNDGRWQNRTQKGVSDNRRGRNDQVNDRGRNNANARNTNDRRNWGNQDRRRHVDYKQYRRHYNASRRYQVARYRWNDGNSYRRYSYGQRLPRHFYGRNFWLSNFAFFGLFAPPPGLIWVRYGPDALLIDEYTGEIIQVRYNMFYS